MKTAKEWESCRQREGLTYWSLPNSNSSDYKYMDRAMIEQIQLDAMKEGARRAAGIGGDALENYAHEWRKPEMAGHRTTVSVAILTAAEQWTEKDL